MGGEGGYAGGQKSFKKRKKFFHFSWKGFRKVLIEIQSSGLSRHEERQNPAFRPWFAVCIVVRGFWIGLVDGKQKTIKATMKITASVMVASVLLAVVPEMRAQTSLSDNLTQNVDGADSISATDWAAGSFSVDGSTRLLHQVTLNIRQINVGAPVVDIYADDNLKPGAFLASLLNPPSIPTSFGDVIFEASNLTLAPLTRYWVVFHASGGGQYEWAWTASNSGTGNGFQKNWGVSFDSGSTWETGTDAPMLMSVDAVPEPGSFALVLLGLSGLWLRSRRSAA